MKNILIVGGSSGISEAFLNLDFPEQVQFYTLSRTQPKSSSVWHPWDALNPTEDLTAFLPEQLHAFLYFPGTVNLMPFNRITPEDLSKDYQVNVGGFVSALKACLPALRAGATDQNPSSVTCFSSVIVQTGMPFHTLVASSKGALEGLTRNLAAEMAPKIRFNAIAPSLVDTPLTAKLTGNEKIRQNSEQKHPLKRIGTAQEIARAAQFVSLEAHWMTGQILTVDGGMGSVRV